MPQSYANYYFERCRLGGDKPDTKFAKWVNQIEKQIKNKLNVSLLDLPDEPYMAWYESGESIDTCVEYILEDSHFYSTF